MYSATGRTAATAANTGHGVFSLWNPHATQRIKVLQFAFVCAAAPGAGAGIKCRRISTRGTAATGTTTPGIANHSTRGIAPPSGALLDLGPFTALQPTADGDNIGPGWVFAAVAASGIVYTFPGGLEIPPSTGVLICNSQAIVVPAGDGTFVWLEDY